MIGEPVNDAACLSKITERAEAMSDSADIRNVAQRFEDTGELAAWIRSLPQRNDKGDPYDGPRVSCDVPQRLRLPADDPNCVERAALYLCAAELIDPDPIRQLATMDTPLGRHTFPVEDDVPVRLDPRLPRNALDAGLWRIFDPDDIRNASPREALDWIVSITDEPAADRLGGDCRLRNAERAFDALLDGKLVPRNAYQDVAYVLGLAQQTAKAFGDKGIDLVRLGSVAVRHALRMQRNAFGFRLGGLSLRPDWNVLGSIGKIGAQVGVKVGSEYVKSQLGAIGIGLDAIAAVEKELKSEGLTLGALAAPPPQTGTLAALTTSALLQKQIANSNSKAGL